LHPLIKIIPHYQFSSTNYLQLGSGLVTVKYISYVTTHARKQESHFSNGNNEKFDWKLRDKLLNH